MTIEFCNSINETVRLEDPEEHITQSILGWKVYIHHYGDANFGLTANTPKSHLTGGTITRISAQRLGPYQLCRRGGKSDLLPITARYLPVDQVQNPTFPPDNS